MHHFKMKSFFWFVIGISLLLEPILVSAGTSPVFDELSRNTRDADPQRRYNRRRFGSSRRRTNSRRYNVGQVVGGTVLAGGAAAFGAGVLTNNQGLRDAGLTSVLAGGALKGVSTLLGKK